ncbi:MAG: protein kinase domain-containing protein [Gammaproteobacteria bacterium]
MRQHLLECILVVEGESHLRFLAKYCTASRWPDARIELCKPARGLPGRDFAWHRYNLLLLEYDLKVPGVTGLDWLRHVKTVTGAPPVVMVLSDSDKLWEEQALELGARCCVSREDLSPRSFVQTLSTVMQGAIGRVSSESKPQTRVDLEATIPLNPLKAQMTAQLGAATVQALETNLDKTQILPHMFIDADNRPSIDTLCASGSVVAQGSDTERARIKIPGYGVTRALAQGGMASIFVAQRKNDGLQVALKILHLQETKNQELLTRFMHEYELMQKLDHPHVAKIFGRDVLNDFAYIVMEYFPGGDLKTRVKEGIAPGQAVEYLKQIASGLGAVHELGIVHRDMKPANILLRANGALAITDFGIAKDLAASLELTAAGALLGTLFYSSPEQVRGEKVDKRTDLYSLGIIFYLMLTGEQPFLAKSAMQLIEAHKSAPVPRLSSNLAKFQPVLDRLLAKDVAQRFQDTRELLAHLP